MMNSAQILVSIAVIAATTKVISSEPQRVQQEDLLPERGPDPSSGGAQQTRDNWHQLQQLSSHQRSRRHAAADLWWQQRQAPNNNGQCQYRWSWVGNSYGWHYTCNNVQARTPLTYNYFYTGGQQPGSWNYGYNYQQQQQKPSTYGYNYQQQQQKPSTTYSYNYQQPESGPLTYNYSYRQQQSRPSISNSHSNNGRHRETGRRRHHRSGRRHHRRSGRRGSQ